MTQDKIIRDQTSEVIAVVLCFLTELSFAEDRDLQRSQFSIILELLTEATRRKELKPLIANLKAVLSFEEDKPDPETKVFNAMQGGCD